MEAIGMMLPISVGEALEAKKQTEEAIQQLVQHFCDRTGLTIREVKLEFVTFAPLSADREMRLALVKLDVRL